MEQAAFMQAARFRIKEKWEFAARMIEGARSDQGTWSFMRKEIQQRMTRSGAQIRDPERIDAAKEQAWALYKQLNEKTALARIEELPEAFRTLDLGLTHALFLEAIAEYLQQGGKSRGSFLVLDRSGNKPCPDLEDAWRYSLNQKGAFVDRKILEIGLDSKGRVRKDWVDVRPIPEDKSWFETTWADFRNDQIIR